MQTEAYRELDRQWRSTCRTVLGGEIGELDDFSEWLSGLNDPLVTRKSSSGKPVVMTSENYCKGARVLRLRRCPVTSSIKPCPLAAAAQATPRTINS